MGYAGYRQVLVAAVVQAALDLDRGAIGLAEQIFTLLGQGRFTATYKYAVLLALMDLCLAHTSKSGTPPQSLTTRQLAAKVIEIYWPHTKPFRPGSDNPVLFQNFGGRQTQAEIVSAVSGFRQQVGGLAALQAAKAQNPQGYRRLLNRVEWKLIEMPLPRLQRVSGQLKPFLYTVSWNEGVSFRRDVQPYQRDEPSDFDNRILLRPMVGEHLVRLNRLLRPLIHREWAVKVAQINQLEEARLQDFLFGATRVGTERIRGPLEELQGHRCFYCNEILRRQEAWRPEVDHFIPWARYPDNGLFNLVVAHRRCNHAKRDFLAATDHVERWLQRFRGDDPAYRQLCEIGQEAQWDLRDDETAGVAAAIYLHLEPDVELWQTVDEFAPVDLGRLGSAFAACSVAD